VLPYADLPPPPWRALAYTCSRSWPACYSWSAVLCLLVFRARLRWRTGVVLLVLYTGYLAYRLAGK
jgi:hypothetical protein